MDPAAPALFDPVRTRRLRERARHGDRFVLRAIAELLGERLACMNRLFNAVLAIGEPVAMARAPERLTTVNTTDPALADVSLCANLEALPFAPGSFDLITITGELHSVNDLPGCLIQLNRLLRPDGLLLAGFPGGDTLWRLRQVLIDAEDELTGRVARRVAPMVDVRDAGQLLQRAGFAMPVADAETLAVDYAGFFSLLGDLRVQGLTSTLRQRQPLRRAVLARAAALYEDRFALPGQRVAAGFTIIILTGWAPAPGQPQPLRPGSARVSLTQVLGQSTPRS